MKSVVCPELSTAAAGSSQAYMLHRPKVLMMDEPTIGLDPMARRVVRDRVRALRETLGMTMLVTTHDMVEADELCDRMR